MAELVRVAKVSDIPPGTMKEVDLGGGRLAALANVDGVFHAIDNCCPHRGGPIGAGFIEGHLAECPWHGWQFDVRTGACVFNPSTRVPVFSVKVEGDDIYLALEQPANQD